MPIALLFVAAAIAAPPEFAAAELSSYPGAPPGLSSYFALALGPGGAVAGSAFPRGTLWSPLGTQTIPSLGGATTIAAAVNSFRGVAGWSLTPAGDPHAFAWDGGAPRDLGTLGGRGSWAFSINNGGTVVGQSDTAAGAAHAFWWRDGAMHDLGSLPGRADSEATAVNTGGRIVGNAYRSEADSRAFVYANGVMSDLGLPPWARATDWVTAFDVNDSGVIVGATGDLGNPAGDRGFAYVNGAWMNLGTLNGGFTAAAAVNNAGDVVGSGDHGFLWRAGEMYDLNALGIREVRGTIDSALDINNAGQILVHALETGPGGFVGRFYVLTPVPGPGAAVVIGMVGAWAGRRRKRAARA